MKLKIFINGIFVLLTFANYVNAQKCLEGNCQNGNGTIEYKGGDRYVGSFILGMMDGKGTMTYVNGDVYTGEYKKNLRVGFGRYTFVNGDVFTGTFINDIGKGKMHDIYDNSIVGKLMKNNTFAEDQIALGNLTAKIKKSLVFISSSSSFPTTGIFYDQNKFMCTAAFSLFNSGQDTISAALTFSNGVTISDVKLININESRLPTYFQILTPLNIPVIPFEFTADHEAAANTKIIKIGGENLSVATGSLIQGRRGLITDITFFNAGKQSPVFNRRGDFIGFTGGEEFIKLEATWLALMGL